ncbi:hypothetical protein AQUCO_02600399v1 [Aquilegia coerulea]|uniref:Uncharacterized protein n=1 Tax=Aquilegia coerulea TaxID=218851 RepID=A0A2G5D8W6_AQUCA|nr:hypothetical protein AQUCO_02600399v1 [Aquilegia coerulea]
MEFPLIFRTQNSLLLPLSPSTSFTTTTLTSNLFTNQYRRCRRSNKSNGLQVCIRASSERSSNERIDGGRRDGHDHGRFAGTGMEVTTFNQTSFSTDAADFPVWDKLGAVVRLSYGIGIYGAMAVAGRFICSFTGIDSLGGFHLSIDAILEALGYAVPPIMALLLILDDEVVKLSPHARAIRDVEDEELRSFFYGMSPWQFILVVTASSIGEELFYRAAVQVSSWN